MTDIKLFYKKVLQIPEGDVLEELVRCSDLETYDRGEMLLVPEGNGGDACFLVSGKIRGYLIAEDGKDITVRFAYHPGDLILEDPYEDEDSLVFWEAITAVELVTVPENTLRRLMKNDLMLCQLTLQRLWDLYLQTSRLHEAYVTMKAKDRYLWFREMYPDFPKDIPQKYVAAYLNMLPQTLSQVRRSLKQGEKPAPRPKKARPVKVRVKAKRS